MSNSTTHHYVLVHGAWHGAWCWEKVTPLLIDAGHVVHTLDLPGLGEDNTQVLDVTLDSYVKSVTDLVEGVGEPVVLVGHSMGGMVITQTAERIADKIDSLIYLTAFSPKHRETLLQYSLDDADSLVSQYKQLDEEDGILTVADSALKECFYGLCSDEDANAAIKRLRPQALAPLAMPLKLSDKNYGSVRRCYIECNKDKAISPGLQRRMKGNASVAASAVLETDHSPFYSCPQELVDTLIAMSES